MIVFLEHESEDFGSSISSFGIPYKAQLQSPSDEEDSRIPKANKLPNSEKFHFIKKPNGQTVSDSGDGPSLGKCIGKVLPFNTKSDSEWSSSRKDQRKPTVIGPKPEFYQFPLIAEELSDEEGSILEFSEEKTLVLERRAAELKLVTSGLNSARTRQINASLNKLAKASESSKPGKNLDHDFDDSLLLRPQILFAQSDSNVSASYCCLKVSPSPRNQCSGSSCLSSDQ